MGTYFLHSDGLITNPSIYGRSLPTAEKTTGITAYTLTTSDNWSAVLSAEPGSTIDSIAVNVKSRSNVSTAVLSATLAPVVVSNTVNRVNVTTSTTNTPFNPVTDGSVAFSGSTSYLYVSGSPDIDLLYVDFTLEFWAKFPTTGNAAQDRIVMLGTANDSGSLQIFFGNSAANGTFISMYVGAYAGNNTTTNINDNQWHHLAVTYQGDLLRFFIDGNQIGTTYKSTITLDNAATQGLYIGSSSSTTFFSTFSLSNFRIVKGTALYTQNFTRPALPLEAIPGTTFLYKSPYNNTYISTAVISNPITSTFPISSFTQYDGSDNLVGSYSQNWQLLKLSAPYTCYPKSNRFKLNLKTSNPNELTLLVGTSSSDYNRIFVSDSNSNISSGRLSLTTNSTLLTSTTAVSPFGNNQEPFCKRVTTVYYGPHVYVLPSTFPMFYPKTAAYTIEGWFNVEFDKLPHAKAVLVMVLDGANTHTGWVLYVDKATQTVRFVNYRGASGGTTITSGIAIAGNTWYHIAIASDGYTDLTNNRVRMYVNGVLQATSAAAMYLFPNDAAGAYFMIGRVVSDSNGFGTGQLVGSYSNVRITYNKCLYTDNFNVPTSPLSSYVGPDAGTTILYQYPYKYDFLTSPVPSNIHIGSTIDNFNTQNRTITAVTALLSGNAFIHKGGLLKFSNTSASLSVQGLYGLQVMSEGTIEVGTSTTPIPSATTHEIILKDNFIGINNRGNFSVHGAPKLAYTRFSQDYNAGVNNFTTTESISSWRVGDTVVLIPNTTSNTTTEVYNINSFSNNKNFAIAATTLHPHPSLSYVPNVANLTRNVKIRGYSHALPGNIQSTGNSFVDINNVEFSRLNGSLFPGGSSNSTFSVNNCTLSSNGVGKLIETKSAGGGSAFFNGASYITTTGNTDFNVAAGTNFTFEFFVKYTIPIPAGSAALFTYGRQALATGGGGGAFSLQFRPTTGLRFAVYVGSGATDYYIDCPLSNIPFNVWNHIAIVAQNSVMKLYVNGIFLKSMPQYSWWTEANQRVALGATSTSGGVQQKFTGYLSNVRFVKGLAVYTSNFVPPTQSLTPITQTGVTTALLMLHDPFFIKDGSYNNETITNVGAIEMNTLDTPFGRVPLIANINNNILFKTSIGLNLAEVAVERATMTRNLLLGSTQAGINITNSLKGNLTLENNISVGPSPYGLYLDTNILGVTLSGGIVNYNNTYGTYITNAHKGLIDNIVNTYSTKEGVYVDGTILQSNEMFFSNITASNNRTVGFCVTGNPVNDRTPITLNIDRLVANNNLSAGFEAYNISGNFNSLELNGNTFYGMKTSIGNYSTTINGITALMNNVATASAGIGIMSGTCYYPVLINNARVGKAVAASIFGAGISLNSTNFSEFAVTNSIISGGSSDFQLRTTNGIFHGSYLISNTRATTVSAGIAISQLNYQSDVYKATGFVFTNMNNLTGYSATYLAAGSRTKDYTIASNIKADTAPSERLTPQSTSLKLRSGSKFVALTGDQSTNVGVYVRKSTLAENGVRYNGNPPRLILKSNAAVGIVYDIVLSELGVESKNFLRMSGTTPAVNNAGVLEFYVDCDGTQGWINIDNWTAK